MYVYRSAVNKSCSKEGTKEERKSFAWPISNCMLPTTLLYHRAPHWAVSWFNKNIVEFQSV